MNHMRDIQQPGIEDLSPRACLNTEVSRYSDECPE
jgi:hypothetical protein